MEQELSKGKKIYKRSHFFIQKPFQFRFALVIFLAMLTIVIGAFFGIYLFNWKLISQFFLQKGIYVNLYGIFRQANLNLVIQLIILSSIVAVASIFVSHKIAGPAYRLEHNIRTVINDDLTLDCKLRKNDELRSLADSLESLIVKLNGEFRNSRKLLNEAVSSLEIMQNDLRSGKTNVQEVQAGLDKVKRIIEELKAANSKVQLRQ